MFISTTVPMPQGYHWIFCLSYAQWFPNNGCLFLPQFLRPFIRRNVVEAETVVAVVVAVVVVVVGGVGVGVGVAVV